jgi:hypothetical protein
MSARGQIDIIREPDGVVRVGQKPIAATYPADVHLPGLTVAVDPSDTDPAAHALVYDAELAHPLVEALFGSEVADAVTRGAAGSATPVFGAELAEIAHLGQLSWLERYRPVALDPGLLALETAVAGAGLSDDETAIREPWVVAAISGLARRVREDPGLPLAGRLRQLVQAAFLHLPVDPDEPALAHERELWLVQERWGDAVLEVADLEWLAGQITPASAGNLGDARTLSGTSPLDWERVPAALLPAGEDTVGFEVSEGRVEVTVEAPPQPLAHPAVTLPRTPTPRLVAGLRSSDWPVPLAGGELSLDAANRRWHGSFSIVPDAMALARTAPELGVDVRSLRLPWEAPNLRRSRAAAARRWVARGIEAHRLSAVTADNGLAQAGTAALRFAARLWAAAGRRDRADRCLELATGGQRDVRLGLAEEWLLASGGGDAPWPPSAGG